MPSSIQIRSYAKINWALDVLFKRPDGYHQIRTIFQTVSLYDRLRVTETDRNIEIVCNDPRVPCDETNLAHKSAALLREATGTSKGARIDIEKNIPVAAGLGGGSSNAAVTLMALVKLWEVELEEHEMIRLAASLGSDVPFFLAGGTALGIGRGEDVYPIEQARSDYLLLVNPGFAVSTRDAYENLSRLTTSEASSRIPFTLRAARGIRELPLEASNDLEEVVLGVHPEIAEVKRRLVSLGARHALMSGSGATVFGVFDNSQLTGQAASEMRVLGYWTEPVRTIDRNEYQSTIFG